MGSGPLGLGFLGGGGPPVPRTLIRKQAETIATLTQTPANPPEGLTEAGGRAKVAEAFLIQAEERGSTNAITYILSILDLELASLELGGATAGSIWGFKKAIRVVESVNNGISKRSLLERPGGGLEIPS